MGVWSCNEDGGRAKCVFEWGIQRDGVADVFPDDVFDEDADGGVGVDVAGGIGGSGTMEWEEG